MLTISIKITPKRIGIFCVAVAIAATGTLWVKSLFAMRAENQTAALSEKIKVEKAPAKTNQQRVEFLSQFGWTVQEEPDEILEVVIPKEFDEVYQQYNEIQKAQGCDLEKYAGKRCKRYSYNITNYPDHPENIHGNLIVYNGKIIGGDVCSLELDGFMHGFAIASAQ